MAIPFSRRRRRRGLTVAATAVLAAGVTGLTATATAAATAAPPPPDVSIASEISHDARASQPAVTSGNLRATRVCPAAIVAGLETCLVLKRNGLVPLMASASPDAIPAGVGYGPSQLQSAYNLTSASASDGSGRTIAIVDAFDDPTAASDLASYRSSAGLPAVPSFVKLNQNGQASPLPSAPPANDDWTLEESLDLDMASAICPLCKIVLVEADNDAGDGLFIAENSAAGVAGYISNSWGGSETSTDTSLDSLYFNHPGDVITASAGDSDYGVIYPAASPDVVSVGGTKLVTASNSRGWSESAWNTTPGSQGTGSGCSAFEPQPSWQTALGLSGCSKRIDNDVAADADPGTGVAVYDTSNGNGGWNEVGGSSASSPMLAAMFALAGNPGSTPADDLYTHPSDFFDVTTGGDGTCSPAYLCTAETGYDGPTGIGTPDGIAGLVPVTCAARTQLLGNPGFETGSAAPWTTTPGVINPNGAGETAHSGRWYAWLDGYGAPHTDTLAQTVTIPAGCSATSFSFWLHIDTAETTTTTAFDKLTVTANGTTIATFSNLNSASGYQQHTYSLGSFAGSSVTVELTGVETTSLQTSFVVDDTAVNTN